MSNKFYDVQPEPGVDLPEFLFQKNRSSGTPTGPSDAGIGMIPRRQFLKLSGIAGGGLVLAFALGGATKAKAGEKTGDLDDKNRFSPNAFVQIRPDGTVILAAHSPEAGQGVKTALPMIIAEELEVPWESVTVKQSGISWEKYGRQVAGGSDAVPNSWMPLREAGATARTMLVQAAAMTWGVADKDCVASGGSVHHRPTGNTLTYGALATKAATLAVPEKDQVRLKSRKEYKLLGKFITGVDNTAIVTGQPLFGIDIRFPGMLYAVYVKCPQFRGKPKQANLDAIKQRPGVVDAFIVEGNGNVTQLEHGVAIVAKSTYEAFQAEKALQVAWDKSNASSDSWMQSQQQARQLTAAPSDELDNSGDFDKARADAESVVESYYSYPYLSHAPMEPQNCTAWLHDGQMEMWISSQTPQGVAGPVAAIVGIDQSNVLLHQMRIGGGFGRRLDNDYACEAAAIAKHFDVPVKLQWTREADLAHDFYRVGGFHNLTGCLDDTGKLVGLRDRTVLFVNPDDEKGRPVRGGAVRAYSLQCPEIPNVRFEGAKIPSRVPTGWWRAPGSCSLAWVFQGFIHELAVKAKRDHLEFLLEQLGEPRWLGKKGAYDFNTERAINVIKEAARHGDWGTKMPKGRGRGLAFYFSHKGYFAEVAEVTVDGSRNVKVDRVVAVGDVGMVLNKSGAENQVEGSIVDAISVLAGQEITFEDGRINEGNFDSYPLARMSSTPKIEVHWLTTDYDPTGLGEPAFPPTAPAITNAIFDATGVRIRSMPVNKEGFKIV